MKATPALKRFRFLWGAHPLWALVETWLLGLLILFPLSRVIGHLPPAVFDNGTLMLCGACGLWMVLRTRVPEMRWPLQVAWELAVGIALSLLMAAGLRLCTDVLGWSEVWDQGGMGDFATVLLLMTGPGYLVARIGVRGWLLWNRVRQRRMLLSLTHAHLTLVILVMAALLVVAAIPIVASEDSGLHDPESGGAMARFADRVFRTAMPLVGIWSVMMVVAVAVMLPPSALISYVIARRTTRRLERLAETARAMREGDYSARVDVAGEDEVAQLQADFNAMAGELERTLQDLEAQRDTVARLLDSRRALLAGVSHELRTPVATVRAMLESALKREETPPAALRHDLEVMEGEVLRLQRLIADLFTLSRLEVEQLTTECQPTDVAPLVQRIVDAIAPLAWEGGRVAVVADLSGELPRAYVDESRLEQVLANLLRNGVRHTPPGGIVAVMAASETDVVRIEVRDTGEGIPPEDLPHVWERFYRGAGARAQDARGVGLGLALVKELTEAMGGSVEVESVVGEGSRFVVRLPRSDA